MILLSLYLFLNAIFHIKHFLLRAKLSKTAPIDHTSQAVGASTIDKNKAFLDLINV